jgi:hypothetical protein
VVPGKGVQADYLSENPNLLEGKVQSRGADLVFDAGFTFSNPTDPALAVGPEHVFVVWNTSFAIFDKDGNELLGDTNPFPSIFPSNGCCDLTVSYDNAADRWVISFLGGGAQIAVSQTGNPLTTDWNVYSIPGVNDYNKLSVWSDGYYLTDQAPNIRLYAMDREAMLAGDPNPSIQGFALPNFSSFGFASAQALNVTDDTMPAPGNAPVVFLQDDAYAGVTVDHIKFWNADVDFDTPDNSTISTPQEITVTPFTSIFNGGGFVNLQQPNPGGGTLDALQGIIMNQAQFRKFPNHNSAVFNHVIDIDPGAGTRAAIRWYEFRQSDDGEPWSLFQEGTYESPDNKHAWNASLMMDEQGNIGMGYTAMSQAGQGNTNVSSYYTGRFVSDPLGTMTVAEEPIVIGDGVIVGNRYGDYSKIDIDPSDDQTFFFTNEIHTADTPNAAQRAANVGRFKIAPDFDVDTGIIAFVAPQDGDLSATETITVMVRNFGTLEQSNIPLSFTIDGGAPVTEMFTGTIPPSSNVEYTFTATADLSVDGTTYTLCAATGITGDEFPDNDELCMDVTHLNDNDTGVVSVDTPVSGSGLGGAEEVTITIQNFGAVAQTSIPVFYTLDGGAPINETYTGSLEPGMTDSYSFTVTADLSELADYVIVTGTELPGDEDMTNDDTTANISNTICQPVSDCDGFNDGVTVIQLVGENINTTCGMDPDGYSNDTDIIFNFVLDNNPFEGILQMGFENEDYAFWIDFNDDTIFESNELVVSGSTEVPANTDVPFTINLANFPNLVEGSHLMRVRGFNPTFAGDLFDPCDDLQFGRTNDYTANITGTLSVDDAGFGLTDLLVHSLGGDQFEVVFNNTTSLSNELPVTIYNTLGQTLAYYVVERDGAGFRRTIDMSHVSQGVYFVKVGTDDLNKVKRIIVQ